MENMKSPEQKRTVQIKELDAIYTLTKLNNSLLEATKKEIRLEIVAVIIQEFVLLAIVRMIFVLPRNYLIWLCLGWGMVLWATIKIAFDIQDGYNRIQDCKLKQEILSRQKEKVMEKIHENERIKTKIS